MPRSAKLCSMIPSLLPISTTNGSEDARYVSRTNDANEAKWRCIHAEVEEKNA